VLARADAGGFHIILKMHVLADTGRCKRKCPDGLKAEPARSALLILMETGLRHPGTSEIWLAILAQTRAKITSRLVRIAQPKGLDGFLSLPNL
jgi:hypothetical protein